MIEMVKGDRISFANIFSIKLPSGWKVKITGFIYNFYNPLGKGALQVSTYLKKDKVNLKVNLREEIKKVSKQNTLKSFKEIKKDDFDYASASFVNKKFYTEIRVIYDNKENFALLTYNCNKKDKDLEELRDVRTIFNSFKFN